VTRNRFDSIGRWIRPQRVRAPFWFKVAAEVSSLSSSHCRLSARLRLRNRRLSPRLRRTSWVRGAVTRVLLYPMVSQSNISFKVQTSPLEWIGRPLESWEPGVLSASLGARYRRYEVDPLQRTHSGLGTDMKLATDKFALRSS
jgi:hypothetical protein